MNLNIIEGPYLADLLVQPAALRAARENLANATLAEGIVAKLRNGQFQRVVLTGMGSSLHALYPLHRALSGHGLASHWMETAELLLGFDALYRPDTLLVAVSQSGESAEMVALLERAGEFGHVLGVTNNPQSRLGRTAASTVTLQAGYFDSLPHRKLRRIVARRVSDGAILKLIRGWLRAPIVKPADRDGGSGHRPNRQ